MEAARTLTRLPERMRRRRFTAACEELRPLGIAYVLRRFGGSLDRADAEDVVAEVIIRFDRLDAAGRPPERLRPAFFQSVRNASLDLLRYRGVRPTAPLEAAAAETSSAPAPEERAEAHEDLARLREAMARMRPGYRETIVLRFGLGLTVPEIAERLDISLPAAKKRVLRSTAQIRERMEAIEERRFCAEIQQGAEDSAIDRVLVGTADETETAAIKAHLEHCGSCRRFLADLRSNFHELGTLVLLGGLATGKAGLSERLLSGLETVAHGAHSGAQRVRLASYRAGGAFRAEGADSAGLLAGGGQKIAALCTAGAAGAGACIATGIVGPGIGVASHQLDHHHSRPPAHVRQATDPTRRPLITYPPASPVQSGEAASSAGHGDGAAAPGPGPAARTSGEGQVEGKDRKPRRTRTGDPFPDRGIAVRHRGRILLGPGRIGARRIPGPGRRGPHRGNGALLEQLVVVLGFDLHLRREEQLGRPRRIRLRRLRASEK